MMFVPIFPVQAGLRFTPQSAGTAISAPIGVILLRATGKYICLNLMSQACPVLSSALIATMGKTTQGWCPFVYLAIYGLGYGGMLIVTLIALVEPRDQATATSALFTFRAVGSTLGVTICSAMIQNTLRQFFIRNLHKCR